MKRSLALLAILLLAWVQFAFAQSPCAGNFDCDQDVDGTDAAVFKDDFGRNPFFDPCPISDPCYLCSAINPIARTGQTTCYDESGTPRNCTGTGEDGEFQTGVPWPNPRFSDNDDETTTDLLAGLLWLTDANCIATQYPGFDNDGTPGDGMVTWQHALDFVSGINDGTYPNCGAGFTDWRVPNIRELGSLVDYGHSNPALPTGYPFDNIQFQEHYWSSSSNVNNPSIAWGINMEVGGGQRTKSDVSYLLPVRGSYNGTPITTTTTISCIQQGGDCTVSAECCDGCCCNGAGLFVCTTIEQCNFIGGVCD